MRTLDDLITEVQENCGDADATYYTDATVVRQLDKAFLFVWARILAYEPELFYATYDLSITANTREYDLPIDFAQMLKVEDRQGVASTAEGQILWRKSFRRNVVGFGWEMRGSKFRLSVNPVSTVSNKYRLHYVYRPPRCVYGTAYTGSTGTALKLGTPTAGTAELNDDAYNHSRVYLSAGTSLGNVYDVDDYSGGTSLTITLETGATCSTTSVYSIVPDVPEFAWELVVLRATMKCLLMQDQNPKLGYYKQEYREEKKAFNAVLRQRARDASRMVTEID